MPKGEVMTKARSNQRISSKRIYHIILFFLFFQFIAFSSAQVPYEVEFNVHHPVFAENGMVATQELEATKIGVDILKQGGNAIDAAVGIGFTLAVTHPQAGNIGGGGFMVIHTKEGKTTTIDFREVAPKSAFRDMFLDDKGDADPNKSLKGYGAIGVPGTVKGLLYALDTYGTLSRDEVLDPAIQLARNGFFVSKSLADTFANYADEMMAPHKASQEIFYKDGKPLQYGDLLVQKDLARSLTLIRNLGDSPFYEGEIAEKIVAAMEENDGFITMDDLKNYEVTEREPVTGTYKGYTISSMAPPSSGGIHIIQILNILENFDLQALGPNSADSIHLMVEAMRRAYADRSEYLGDPEFVDVPVEALISKEYAKAIAETISLEESTPSPEVKPGDLTPYEPEETTHYSVIDKEGNAVAVTYTLNTNFGTGIVAEGTGILLNNEMDDFSSKPGVPNIYGLIGGEANAIEPFKRPLSSMSPTIVTKDGEIVLVTGSPGGARIITTVLQIILNTVEHGMNVAEATHAPRIHHQWYPDYIRLENGFSADTIQALQKKGHDVKIQPAMGSTQSIMKDEKGLHGTSDPRRPNALSLGY